VLVLHNGRCDGHVHGSMVAKMPRLDGYSRDSSQSLAFIIDEYGRIISMSTM
jgi:hypothetical protein